MPSFDEIQRAADQLRAGGIVAFPTETVYGLGADARQPKAIKAIFKLKGRPLDHPLIVHLGETTDIRGWARNIPEIAYDLADAFWPGPLTLILARGEVPDEVTGGQDSIGLRVPSHPVARELLRTFGSGIAAPSANRFGRVSPTRSEHVKTEFPKGLEIILDGGSCDVGLESTIISLLEEEPILLRPGAITLKQLERVTGQLIRAPNENNHVRASGLLASHYAPDTAVLVFDQEALGNPLKALLDGRRIALMCFDDALLKTAIKTTARVRMPGDAAAYGQILYSTLRALDSEAYDLILVEKPPETEAWRAIHDRLQKASHDSQHLLASPAFEAPHSIRS